MKKIIISIATTSVFIFTSCFTDSDTATVKINLGNIPVAKTAKVEKKSLIDRFLMIFTKEAVAQEVPEWIYINKVHLGAFDEDNQLLIDKSISVTQKEEEEEGDIENTVVKFDVPAGIRRKIVVLGISLEGDENDLEYYGVSEPIDLIAGETQPVTIEMGNTSDVFPGLELSGSYDGTPAKWNYIAGASKYKIYESDQTNNVVSHLMDTTNNKLSKQGSQQNYSLRVYFDFAKIESTDYFFYIS